MFGFKKKESEARDLEPLIPPASQDVQSLKRRVVGNEDSEDFSTLVPELEPEFSGEKTEELVPYAPVFVKLEKYGELLSDLARAEALVERIKQLVHTMDKIEALRQTVYEGIKEGVKETDNHLRHLDNKFRKPEIPRTEVHKPKFTGVPIEQVQKELEDLKRELQTVRR